MREKPLEIENEPGNVKTTKETPGRYQRLYLFIQIQILLNLGLIPVSSLVNNSSFLKQFFIHLVFYCLKRNWIQRRKKLLIKKRSYKKIDVKKLKEKGKVSDEGRPAWTKNRFQMISSSTNFLIQHIVAAKELQSHSSLFYLHFLHTSFNISLLLPYNHCLNTKHIFIS